MIEFWTAMAHRPRCTYESRDVRYRGEELVSTFFDVVRIYDSIVPQSASNFLFLYIIRAFSGLQMNIMKC